MPGHIQKGAEEVRPEAREAAGAAAALRVVLAVAAHLGKGRANRPGKAGRSSPKRDGG